MNITRQDIELEKFCADHNIESFPDGIAIISGEELAHLLNEIRVKTPTGYIYNERHILKMLRDIGLPKPKWGVVRTEIAQKLKQTT